MVIAKQGKHESPVLVVVLALLLASIYPSRDAFSQVAGATLTGTVTDPSGAAIPQATVSIKNSATGVVRSVSTDSAGLYLIPNLNPGPYEATASAKGFSQSVQSGLTLAVGQNLQLNFTLKIGSVAQQVQVTGTPPSVQLGTSAISAQVDSKTVRDLPLNGRDWTQLATLQAGVASVVTQPKASPSTAPRGSRGYGNQMTIAGTRPENNNYRLDGISIVDYAGGGPGSVLGIALGVDAVGEFSVLTANQSAEYGRTSGGVINAVTRSGTNQLHGDAFWFLRDEDFDARNFFDKSIAPFHRNQFGASLGGPIQKDKTFFFADYEGVRQAQGVTSVSNVPSQDARNGLIHNSNGTTTQITVDPLVKPFLGLYPLPNAGLIGVGNTGHFDISLNGIGAENFGTVRVDRKISATDSLFGTWLFDKSSASQPDRLDNVLAGNRGLRQFVALEETHTFSSTLVNSLRGGFNRVNANTQATIQAINPLASDLSLGSFPGRAAPQISVAGLSLMAGGLGALVNTRFVLNSFQAYDDAFLVKGTHTIKFGFAFERTQNNFIIPTRPNGAFKFGSLVNFLTNKPNTFIGGVPGTQNPRGIRQSLLGGYLQDDWRLHPNLTLNLGLRYEMTTVPTEVQNKIANLPTFTSPTPSLGSPYFSNPTLRNFEPRVGFAWDPFHNGKTAVRGAFGIFDILPLFYEFLEVADLTAPFATSITAQGLPAGSFPTGAASPSNIVPSKLQSSSVQTNPPRNYMMIWNLNVQRQLSPSTTLTVGYVGNHGVHMLDRADEVNLVLPTATPLGFLWPSPRGSGTRINPNAGEIRGLRWGGDSEYDALQVGVTKRMSHGFQAQASYTWGKTIDTGSTATHGDTFDNSISSLFQFCKRCRRGLADFNIAHTFVANYIWDVPTPKFWGAVGTHMLGGWELGGIFTAESGVPITPLIGGDPLGLNSQDPFAFPNRLTGPGCGSDVNPGNPNNYIKLSCFAPPNPLTLLGNAGRNVVIGPGLADFDFSMFKNNYIRWISENFDVQFRAEFFNILNRPNFATPIDNETLFDQSGKPVGGAGSVDKTSTTAREIQFSLKLIW